MIILFIGKENQTNNFICKTIESSYSASITFHDLDDLFKDPKVLDDDSLDLVIFDLNSSYGSGNVPQSIRKINQQVPTSPLLVMYPSNHYITKPLFSAGANEVINNTPSESEILDVINRLTSEA